MSVYMKTRFSLVELVTAFVSYDHALSPPHFLFLTQIQWEIMKVLCHHIHLTALLELIYLILIQVETNIVSHLLT